MAIYKETLSATQVSSLAKATTLTGQEANLLAGFVFGDGPGTPLPATLTRPLTSVPGALNVTVSHSRNNTADRALLPLSLASRMRLPFEQGRVANVSQAVADQGGSHKGYAAYCYDVISLSKDINGHICKASAPGTVAHVSGGDQTRVSTVEFCDC